MTRMASVGMQRPELLDHLSRAGMMVCRTAFFVGDWSILDQQ